MKRILIGLLIVILGLTSVNVYKRFTEDSDFKVKFYVYSQRIGKPLEILFRQIPVMYDTLIDIEIIEPYSKELNLYRVDFDIFGGTPDLQYVIYNKDNGEITDLKSELLFKKIKSPENVDLDTIDSYSIDIQAFRLIFEPHLKTSEEIAHKYAGLLTNTLDPINFKRIKQSNDIELILSFHRKTQFPMIDEKKTIKDFEFLNNLADNEFLYWFFDKGLIKIQVDLSDGHLTNIKTLRLGNIGVEKTHL